MRSIPEDPLAFYAPDILSALDPDLWARADQAWAHASQALGATIRGRLFGAALALVPDRRRWRSLVLLPGGDGLLSPDAWRDPARCLVAARAQLASDVVDEAHLWRAARKAGLSDSDVRDLVRELYLGSGGED